MITVLLFDFYGVFLPDAYTAWLTSNNVSREGIYAELIEKRDGGLLDEQSFLAELSKAIGRPVQVEEIHPKNIELDKQLIDLTRQLKTHYQISLFSNASEKLRGKLATLGLDDLFSEIIISSEIGYSKPADQAFESAVQRVNARPDEILFIDDNPKNIEAARRNGLSAHLYVSAKDLQEAIEKLR